MKKVFTILSFFFIATSGYSQYIEIETPFVRDKLKELAPECFDGDKMDTTCSKLLEIKNISFNDGQLGGTQEGEHFGSDGLQYLKNLQSINVTIGYCKFALGNLPISLKSINASIEFYNQNLIEASIGISAPDSVTYIYIKGGDRTGGGSVFCDLPPNLEVLIMSSDYIYISKLPNSLKILDDGARAITDTTILPPSLQDLTITGMRYDEDAFLPTDFPASLKNVYISGFIPNNQRDFQFQEGLENFTLIQSSNIKMEQYPSTLKSLTFKENLRSTIGRLPDNLEVLDVFKSISSDTISYIPNSIKELSLVQTNATNLKNLPGQLNLLNVSDNINLKCLPTLPILLKTLGIANTKVICIPNETNTIKFSNNLPACPKSCDEMPAVLSGIVYLDINKNGRFDGSDRRIQGTFVHINDKILTTDANGFYRTYAETGVTNKISVTHKHPHLEKIQPAERSYFGIIGQWMDTMNFAVQIENSKDIEVQIAPFAARNGFTSSTFITLTNRGAVNVNGFNLSTIFPSNWIIASTMPNATRLVDSLVWSNISLDINSSKTYKVQFTVPATDTIRTPFSVTARTNDITDDIFPENNSNTFTSDIRGSYDPNDKLVYPESLTPGYAEGTELIYTVRFQNTGNDTAFTVVVKDTIQANLDPLSFRYITGTHPSTWSLNEQGIITFTFDNILLPDSNVNEPASNGQVTFAIQPLPNLASGTAIENRAGIYFDFNAPIITNYATSKVEVITSYNEKSALQFNVYPNPNKDILNIRWAEGGKTNLTITDISGKIIFQSTEVGNLKQLPTQNFSKGMYIIQIQNEKGLGTSKIIVQ